jgi:hypothetical protein
LRNFSIEKYVESAHSTLSRDPRDSSLSIQLEGNNLWAEWKVGLDEGVQYCPQHFRLCSGKGSANLPTDNGSGTVSPDSVFAANRKARDCGGLDTIIVLGYGNDVFAEPYDSLQSTSNCLFNNRLPNHEKVLVLCMFKADPPLALARCELAIRKGRACYRRSE